MKKRILSMLLVVAMLLSALVGCGTQEETVSKGDNTLVIGLPQVASITDYDDNGLTLFLEENSGVDIEFQFFSSSAAEAQQQLALMCTTEEKLPDVILGFTSMSHYVANQFGEDGFFIDLTDLIDKYAVNYKEQLEKLPQERQDYIKTKGTNTITGETYGMPRVMYQSTDNRQSMIYINKTWLDTLGLQVPTTIAELETVLKAFETQDPNGNGKNDEMAYLGGPAYIINAYVCYESATFNVTDGKVWDPVTTPEFRQAMIKGYEMVQNGSWDKNAFTVTATEMKKLISPIGEPSKVGIFSGHHRTSTNSESDVLKDFIALPDLADETGLGGYCIYTEPLVDWMGFITKDCENPELAMKLLDTFYMDKACTIQARGIEGEEWEYKEGTTPYGSKSYVNLLSEDVTKSGNSCWGRNILGVYTEWNHMPITVEGESRAAQATRLQKEQWEIMQTGKQREEILGDLIYTEEEYDVREAKAGVVQTHIAEHITLFMSGEKNPKDDAVWNQFLKDLETYGRSELLEIAQAAYDRKAK